MIGLNLNSISVNCINHTFILRFINLLTRLPSGLLIILHLITPLLVRPLEIGGQLGLN